MNAEDIKYRKCQVADCSYKELRGSREGEFIAGNFVCPLHYDLWSSWAIMSSKFGMAPPTYRWRGSNEAVHAESQTEN
jgi:hypothetical protein